MSILISLLIIGFIVAIAVWIIGLVPLPPAPFPGAIVKAIAYIIVGVIAIVELLRLLPGGLH